MTKQEARIKAKELVSKMTVEEKASQLLFNSPAIERLGIKAHNWWNEASHGVARAGTATVFPHAIAFGATFNPELIKTVADVISTEGRAKYNKSVEFGDHGMYKGLTYWTPNINIFRDPRWGRGQETYGEDPFLTASIGCATVEGLQGEGDFYKSTACAKHYAVHSGPEGLRHGFNAKVSEYDLWDTYLPAFEHCVKKADVVGVMGAYSALNGVPCCVNDRLINDILRKQWEFDGYFVSDCWALMDIANHHRYTASHKETAALALKTGCQLNCGDAFREVMDAYEEDLIEEKDIDKAVEKLYEIRFLLGEFEDIRPYSDIPFSKLDCKEHQELNLKVAGEAVVLLENNSFLPVDKQNYKKIAVVGPNAMSVAALEGNYNGRASRYVTIADGIRQVFSESEVLVEVGCKLSKEADDAYGSSNHISCAVAAASEADLAVVCLGLDPTLEGEEGFDVEDIEGLFKSGDKLTLKLPPVQQKLAEKVCQVCDNVIIVTLSGSGFDLGEELTNKAKAVIHGWYPGALGGLSIAKIIAGEQNPSGKLPITFYKADNALPEITDYSMKGRTYKYIEEQPLYPFGFGLSYSKFEYSDFTVLEKNEDILKVRVTVKNVSKNKGTEKVQIYTKFSDSRTITPNFQLCGVKAVELNPNEAKTIEIEIDKYWLKAVLQNGERVVPNGEITLFVGSNQPDERSYALTGTKCLEIKI